VSAFRALQQAEQIQLLKGGSIELLILRSVLTFDPDKQQFLDRTDSAETRAMKVDQLQTAVSGTGVFDAHMAFVHSIAVDLQVLRYHFTTTIRSGELEAVSFKKAAENIGRGRVMLEVSSTLRWAREHCTISPPDKCC